MSWILNAIWTRQDTSPFFDGNYPNSIRPIEAWRIDATYKVGQKLPMRVIYPRPDVETADFALHRKASANFAYQTRICIQGGEAPFKYEIISGPVGATIVGEFDRTVDPETGLTLHTYPTDYATVTWANPTGTSPFVVRVTDQSDTTVDVTWTAETDETAFVVLDSVNGNDSNLGTWASPLQTFVAGLWKNDPNDTTYASKIAVFKDGTYPINAGTLNSNADIYASQKPLSYLAVGNAVVFDTNNGHFGVFTGNIAFVGMEFRGSRSDLGNNRIITMGTKNSNYFFWKIKFSQQTQGTAVNDNPSSIFFMGDNTYGSNIALVDSELLPTATLQMIVTYSSDGVLIENNRAENVTFTGAAAIFIHAKDNTKNLTVRFNYLTGGTSEAMIKIANQQTVGMLAFNQEVNYNYLNSTENAPLGWNQNATATPNASNTNSYRNTIVSSNVAMGTPSFNGGDRVKISGTAWVGTALASPSTGFEEVLPVNVQIIASDINADGSLNESTGKRTTYLGKAGFEIASNA